MKICQAAFLTFLRSDEGKDQIHLLREALEQNWEARYKQLVAYKDKHGHCNVPRKYPENPVSCVGYWLACHVIA